MENADSIHVNLTNDSRKRSGKNLGLIQAEQRTSQDGLIFTDRGSERNRKRLSPWQRRLSPSCI